MKLFLLDASALAKRYYPETATDLVHYLFAQVSRDRLSCLMIGAAEVVAVLVRKRNGGLLSPSLFTSAMGQLRAEVLSAADVAKFPAENALVSAAIPLVERYAINSSDAIALQTALTLALQLRPAGNDVVLLAADQRLLKAAQVEGLLTFNPETQSQADLDLLLQP